MATFGGMASKPSHQQIIVTILLYLITLAHQPLFRVFYKNISNNALLLPSHHKGYLPWFNLASNTPCDFNSISYTKELRTGFRTAVYEKAPEAGFKMGDNYHLNEDGGDYRFEFFIKDDLSARPFDGAEKLTDEKKKELGLGEIKKDLWFKLNPLNGKVIELFKDLKSITRFSTIEHFMEAPESLFNIIKQQDEAL